MNEKTAEYMNIEKTAEYMNIEKTADLNAFGKTHQVKKPRFYRFAFNQEVVECSSYLEVHVFSSFLIHESCTASYSLISLLTLSKLRMLTHSAFDARTIGLSVLIM
jgi:hypothetical protein